MIDAGLDQIDAGFVFYVDDLNVAAYNRHVLEITELLIDGKLRRCPYAIFFRMRKSYFETPVSSCKPTTLPLTTKRWRARKAFFQVRHGVHDKLQ